MAALWILSSQTLVRAQEDPLLEQGRKLQREGRYLEARDRFTAALARAENTDPESPQVAAILDNLGTACEEVGEVATAERSYKQSILILEKRLGGEAIETGIVLSHLGALYVQIGMPSKAEPLLQRALAVHVSQRGLHDLATADVLVLTGNLHFTLGNIARAEEFHRQALGVYEQYQGSEHLQASVLSNLARIAAGARKYQEAVTHAERSLRMLEALSKAPPPALVSTLWVLGLVYARLGRLHEAEGHLGRALLISEQTFGPQSPRTAHAMQDYAAVLRLLKRKREATQLEKRAKLTLTENARANGYWQVVDIRDSNPFHLFPLTRPKPSPSP